VQPELQGSPRLRSGGRRRRVEKRGCSFALRGTAFDGQFGVETHWALRAEVARVNARDGDTGAAGENQGLSLREG